MSDPVSILEKIKALCDESDGGMGINCYEIQIGDLYKDINTCLLATRSDSEGPHPVTGTSNLTTVEKQLIDENEMKTIKESLDWSTFDGGSQAITKNGTYCTFYDAAEGWAALLDGQGLSWCDTEDEARDACQAHHDRQPLTSGPERSEDTPTVT